MKNLNLPLNAELVRSLKIGDPILLSGTIITARDRAHKWLYEHFIEEKVKPTEEDEAIYERLRVLLEGGAIYHCGPVMRKTFDYWEVVAAGPTTSEREEPYEAGIMRHFSVRAVIGKGGMGEETLKACQELPAVYLHAVGGAAVYAAKKIKKVKEVFKLDFGIPEAMWVLEVEDFPCIVTMDAQGRSLHREVLQQSEDRLLHLLSG